MTAQTAIRWLLAILIILALSFAWLALGLTIWLCSLVGRQALSIDKVSVSMVLVEGRLRDAQRSVDGAFMQLRILMRRL